MPCTNVVCTIVLCCHRLRRLLITGALSSACDMSVPLMHETGTSVVDWRVPKYRRCVAHGDRRDATAARLPALPRNVGRSN